MEMKTLNETLVNVRLDLARLEGKVDIIKDLQHKVDGVQGVADDALEQSKSAHLRITDIKKDYDKRFEKIDKITFWFATSIIGGLLLGAINLLYRK
ncbi:hypothetical protein D3C72_2232390 [compost metagenome]